MADVILEFLRFGADPSPISRLGTSTAEPFLPSLATLSADCPSLSTTLLTPLSGHTGLPRASVYASLDYTRIMQEATGEGEEGQEEDSTTEECVCFKLLKEKERVELAIRSLHKRAAGFSDRIVDNEAFNEVWNQKQADSGSMWNDEACLPELMYLLPIVCFRCPMVLRPVHIILGLLTTSHCEVLLSLCLANNPPIVEEALSLLSQFLAIHQEAFYMDSRKQNSSLAVQKTRSFKQRESSSTRIYGTTMIIHCVKQALLTLIRLSKISASLAVMCRDSLMRSHAFAGLVLHITTEYAHDELEFLSKVVFSTQSLSKWMTDHMKVDRNDLDDCMLPLTNDDLCNALFRGSVHCAWKALLAGARTASASLGWCSRLNTYLRLYCVLIHTVEVKPTQEEVQFWLESLYNHFEGIQQIDEETLWLGFMFLLVVLNFFNASAQSLFLKCLSACLKQRTMAMPKELELVVWLKVQLLLGEFSEIKMIVSDIIAIHLVISDLSMKRLQNAAISAGVTANPALIAEAAAALRPPGPISSHMSCEYFTLKCLDQLLASGYFSRFRVDISGAVQHCISIATNPVHPLLVHVIQAYAEIPIHNLEGNKKFLQCSLSLSFMEELLVEIPFYTRRACHLKVDKMIKGALTTYFILCKERILRSRAAELGWENSETMLFLSMENEESEWASLLSKIPFQLLLTYMEKNWLDFEHLLPQWLSLAASLFPEWLRVCSILDDVVDSLSETNRSESETSASLAASLDSCRKTMEESPSGNELTTVARMLDPTEVLTVDTVTILMQRAVKDPVSALHILQFLIDNLEKDTGRRELYNLHLVVMRELVPRLLDPRCSRSLQDRFCIFWKRIPHFLRHVHLPALMETVLDEGQSSRIDPGMVTTQLKEFIRHIGRSCIGKYKLLVQQPLILLACKPQVYRTPLLSVLLDFLQELLITNHRASLGILSSMERLEGTLRCEDVKRALLAQDSAVCQILLEACLPNMDIDDEKDPEPLLKARTLICGFLSLYLQGKPMLFKLLHFQGYDVKLIPVMVQNIPSMVECLHFSSELLQQDESSRIFGMTLIANIVSAHATHPDSLAAAQEVVAHVSLAKQNINVSSEFLQAALGAVMQCACVFTELVGEVTGILQFCIEASAPLEPSGAARNPAIYKTAIDMYEQLRCHRAILGNLSLHDLALETRTRDS